MNNEDTPKWKESKRKELKMRLGKLVAKLDRVTAEAVKFGPRLRRVGFTTQYVTRLNVYRHWHKMALLSLRATRKKIYSLKSELESL